MASKEFDVYEAIKDPLRVGVAGAGIIGKRVAEPLDEIAQIYLDTKFRGNKTYHILRTEFGVRREKEEK